MAVKVVKVVPLERNVIKNDVVAYGTTTDADDGFTVDVSKYADHKLLFLFQNSAASTDYKVTIKKGDALQGVADLEETITQATVGAVVIESGKFMNVSGTDKGLIKIIPANVAVKLAVVALP